MVYRGLFVISRAALFVIVGLLMTSGSGAARQAAPAMATLLETCRPTNVPRLQIAMGWHMSMRPGDREIVWHNGGTGGYRSFVGYDRNAGLGVVVLSNTSTPVGVDDIGMHLLDPRAPLFTPPPPRTAVTADRLCSTGTWDVTSSPRTSS